MIGSNIGLQACSEVEQFVCRPRPSSQFAGPSLLSQVTSGGRYRYSRDVMALLATANRFWLTPKLSCFPTTQEWLARLRLHVLGEQTLGMVVIGIVSVLGTLEPAISK